jgi:hypothetical protein
MTIVASSSSSVATPAASPEARIMATAGPA